MNVNKETINQFTQLYVNLINEKAKKGNPISNILLSSEIENYFGREYLRIYINEPCDDKKYHRSLISGDGNYYSYLVKDRNSGVHQWDDDDNWQFYYDEYNKTFEEYHKDVEYLVGIIKASFPDLEITNKLKRYCVPDCWVHKWVDEKRTFSHWYEESQFSINYVVNNKDVEDINDYVSTNMYGSIKDLHSPYDARIKPDEMLIKELEVEEERQKKLKELIKIEETEKKRISENLKNIKISIIDTPINDDFNIMMKNFNRRNL